MRNFKNIFIIIMLVSLFALPAGGEESPSPDFQLMIITSKDVPADGTSTVDVYVQVMTGSGDKASDGIPVTLSSTGGEILTEDTESSAEGIQAFTSNGMAYFSILSPLEPGEVTLHAFTGKASIEKTLNFISPYDETISSVEPQMTEEEVQENSSEPEITPIPAEQKLADLEEWKESLPEKIDHPENVEIISPKHGSLYPYSHIRVTVRGVSGQQVGLWVNDVLFAEHVMNDTEVYTFNNVPLAEGHNKLVAQAMFDGQTAEDTVLINKSSVQTDTASSEINIVSPSGNNNTEIDEANNIPPSENAESIKIISPENNSTTEIGNIKITVQGKPGTAVTLYSNEAEYITQEVGEGGTVEFLGVNVSDGPNEIKALSGDGSDTIKVFFVGPIANIDMSVSETSIPADGSSYAVFRLRVTDAWGKAVRHGSTITVESTDGIVFPEDADPVNKGHQVVVESGFAEFTLQSSDIPDTVSVKAFHLDVETVKEIEFTTPLRDFILVGHGEGRFGYNDVVGNLQKIEINDEFEEELYSDGGITLFLKGKVPGECLLTMAYDSEKDPDERMFKDINPNDFYPIYGDTSSVTYEAQSSDKLYIALQHGKSFVKYSDFQTGFKETETAEFNRSLTGMNFFHETDRYRVLGFVAETKNVFTRDEIRGQGTSGYYRLSTAPVVINSEQIYIEIRDRYNPDWVLNTTMMSRYIDYDIDYNAGTILFRQPVFSEDQNGNPIFIIATYEGYAGEDERLVYGVRGVVKLGDSLEAGLTYVNEDTTTGNRIMTGGDFKLNISENMRLRGEYTHTDTPQGDDNAYLVDLEGKTETMDFNLYYRKIGAGFDNPNISFIQRKTEKYGARFSTKLGENSSFTSEYYSLKDVNRGLNTDYFSAKYISMYDRFDFEAGYEYKSDEDTVNLMDNTSNIATLKLGYKATERLYLFAKREENFSGGEENNLRYSRPDRTTLGLDYAINEKLTFFARQEFYSQGEESISDTLVGFTSSITDNTSVFARYRVGGAISGPRNQINYGLNNKFQLTDSIRTNFSFERNHSLGVDDIGNSDYTAVSTSLEYLPDRPFKAMAKYEVRFTGDSTEHLINLAADGRLGDSWSLYAEHLQYIDGDNNGLRRPVNFISRHTLLGFAFRPVEYDWINILGKLDIKKRKNDSTFADSTSAITIGSISAVFEPTRKLEIYTQYSFRNVKTEGVTSVSSHTQMFLGRIDYDITNRWGVAGEYRRVWQTETGTVVDAAALELSYLVFGDVRLAAGYAFSGFYDEDFGADNFHSKGPYLGVNIKFSEHNQPFNEFDNEIVEKGRRQKVKDTMGRRCKEVLS